MENEITQEKTADVPVSDAIEQKQSENQTKRKLRLDEEGTPYAICPKCHKRIYSVLETEEVYITYDVSPQPDGTLNYDEADRDGAWDSEYEARCPECDEVIATSEEEVEALFYEDEN